MFIITKLKERYNVTRKNVKKVIFYTYSYNIIILPLLHDGTRFQSPFLILTDLH